MPGISLRVEVTLQNDDRKMVVDVKDLTRVQEHRWWLLGDTVVGLVYGRPVLAHEFVLSEYDADIEFQDGNRLNFSRSNLVVKGRPGNKVSPYKGVKYYARTGRWQAVTQVRGKLYHLGYGATPEEAHRIYLERSEAVRQGIEG